MMEKKKHASQHKEVLHNDRKEMFGYIWLLPPFIPFFVPLRRGSNAGIHRSMQKERQKLHWKGRPMKGFHGAWIATKHDFFSWNKKIIKKRVNQTPLKVLKW